jgi:hypothetical protein
VPTWPRAFAEQAASDLDARDWLLQKQQLPRCHELHFLQMACEKLCKAHLMTRPGADPLSLQKSHAYIAKNLPVIAREYFARRLQSAPKGHLDRSIRAIAERIERLAPANDAGGTAPSNCEYPWIGPAGQIIVPAAHHFDLTLLYEKSGVTLLKLLRVTARQLSSSTVAQQ